MLFCSQKLPLSKPPIDTIFRLNTKEYTIEVPLSCKKKIMVPKKNSIKTTEKWQKKLEKAAKNAL